MCDTAYQQIFPYLPQSLRNLLEALPPEQLRGLEEIRLKPGLPVLLRFDESEALLTSAGNLTSDQTAEGLRLLSPDEMRRTVLLLADSSLYAFEEELRRGYITLNGGHRAGLTGRAVLAQGTIRTIKEISGINIRIARHIAGVALPLLPCLVDAQARLLPTLIISPPRAGKRRCCAIWHACFPMASASRRCVWGWWMSVPNWPQCAMASRNYQLVCVRM